MSSPKIILIGSGSRVTRDILPVLQALGADITIFSRYRRKILVGKEILQVLSYKYDYTQPLRDYYLVISTPPEAYSSILKLYSHSSVLCKHIFLDTPISKEIEHLPDIPLSILEDFPFSPLTSLLIQLRSNHRHLFLFNLLYRYHGVSILRRLGTLNAVTSIFRYFTLADNIITNKRRNYSNTLILSLCYPFIHSPTISANGLSISQSLVDEFDTIESSLFHRWLRTYKHATLFQDIDLLKQVGLKRLFEAVFTDPSKSAYTLQDALCDYHVSECLRYK